MGKPPVETVDTPKIVRKTDVNKKPDEDIFEKAIELTRTETVDPRTESEKPGGGDPDIAPPSGPEIPHFERLDNGVFTMDPAPVINGRGKTVPTLGFRRLGGDGTGLGDAAVSVRLLDNPPRTRFQKAPVYPFAMKTTGTSGTVWVEFMVDETGYVHDVRVLKSTNSEFEEATRDAVSMWRFEPGKRKGIPVRFRMSLPVVFNLTD